MFRDEAPERVVEIVQPAGLRGGAAPRPRDAGDTRDVRQRVPFVIQAFAAGDRALERAAEHGADVILVDSPTPGSGEVFDWALADGRRPGSARILLAGGLTPENVAAAIDRRRGRGASTCRPASRRSPGARTPSS